jgi:hypothetical protein
VRWRAQDEEGAVLRDQLKQAAHLWEEKGRSPDVLWSGTAFREFELWRERYPGALTALEEDFARSMTERARRRRRLRRVADTPEGRRFVVDALWRSPTARILPLGKEFAWTADFSPDGRWLATFGPSVPLLFGDDGGAPRIIRGQPQTGMGFPIRFTPDGEALLVQSGDEARVRMYSVPDGREIRRFEPVPPGGYGTIPRPKPTRYHPMAWTPLPQGILFRWWPEKPSPGAREPFGIWPYDGGPPTLVGSLRGSPTYAWVDAPRSRFLLRRGPRLVIRP